MPSPATATIMPLAADEALKEGSDTENERDSTDR